MRDVCVMRGVSVGQNASGNVTRSKVTRDKKPRVSAARRENMKFMSKVKENAKFGPVYPNQQLSLSAKFNQIINSQSSPH